METGLFWRKSKYIYIYNDEYLHYSETWTGEWVFFFQWTYYIQLQNYPNNSYTEIKHVNHFAHHPMIIVWGIILLLLMF